MKLKNLNGTEDNTCRCPSWLEHWKKYVHGHNVTWPPGCSETFCNKKATVGAHVQIDGDDEWYIVPLCDAHNADLGEAFSVPDDTRLARANVSETCGKR